jgi:hypothetical protein
MRLAAILIVSSALWGGCAHDALLDGRPALGDFPGNARPVRTDSPVGRDIAVGYATYRTVLAGFGEWTTDPMYGPLWCPKGLDPSTFVPYRSHGHWEASDGPAASPYWEAEGGPAWEAITLHHGWWVYEEIDVSTGRWCWVPGAESTPANVAWRTGDGFVGWAPEPPPADPGGVDDDDDTLEWVFEFEGTLFDVDLEDLVLVGDAADTAADATLRSRAERRPGHRSTWPSREEVAKARRALAEYAGPHSETGRTVAHPDVGRTVAHPDVARTAARPGVERRSESGGAPLPRSMDLYARMTSDSQSVPGASSKGALPRVPADASQPRWVSRGQSDLGGRGFHGGEAGYVAHSSSGNSGAGALAHGYGGHGHGSMGSSGSGGGGCGAHSSTAAHRTGR